MQWEYGVGILLGTLIGGVVGFVVQPPPLFMACGLLIGAGLDNWQWRRQNP